MSDPIPGEALEFALRCGAFLGLENVAECVLNIELHAINLWPYEEVGARLDRLEADLTAWIDAGGSTEIPKRYLDEEAAEMAKFFEKNP